MVKPRRRATYDDILALPEHVIGEILDGELVVSPRPAPTHAWAASSLLSDVMGSFGRSGGGPGGWWILFEPELHLHEDVLVPDVAGWRRERMPELPKTPAIELAPNWLCEVLSASTARYDRSGKLRIYEREKVAHVWLVDPANRTLEVFTLDGERLVASAVFGGGDKARVEPFAEVELDLSHWWAE